MEDLNQGENAALGVTTALIEGAILQPTMYWKVMRQQGLPLSVNPMRMYRGFGAALFNEMGQMALQFPLTGLFKGILRDQGEGSEADGKIGANDLIGAMGGGAVTAIFASPVELVMIQQQTVGGTLFGTPIRVLREHGIGNAGFFRGLALASVRDSIYVGGMLGVAPLASQYFQQKHGMTNLPATLAGSALGGIMGGVLSHPFDVVKTCMQGDMGQTKYTSATATLATLLKESGPRRLADGMFWRTFNITATVYIANECCARLPPYVTAFTR